MFLASYNIKSKPDDTTISKIFADPKGAHIIIAMSNAENYYANPLLNIAPQKLAKLSKTSIESVAWNRRTSSITNTGSILIGTTDCCIFEARIDLSDKKDKELVKVFKQVWENNN